jgi:hypothetical protein
MIKLKPLNYYMFNEKLIDKICKSEMLWNLLTYSFVGLSK